jgi:DNA-binding response OmpR family regulator
MNEPLEQESERRSVLVVEDEPLIAMELRKVLREAGFRVLGPVPSVNRALDLLRTERPDTAVLDVTLANEKVTPVAVLLRSMGVPFVLATGSDGAELARHEALAGVANFAKPTDMTSLVKAVRAL